MNPKKKKICLALLPFSFLILAFSIQPGISEELDEDPIKNDLFLAIFHPVVVPIERTSRVETVITLINLGSKPISLGKVDYRTGRLVGGDYELRVSVDISNTPLRHMQIGRLVAASADAPFMSANLISGVTFMPGSELLMAVTALPADSSEVSQGGDAKFTFTLLSSVEGKIKPLIEMRFSTRYEKGKRSHNPRRIQATIEPENPACDPLISIGAHSKDEYMKKVEAASGTAITPKGDAPDIGFHSYVADSEGTLIGLWDDLELAWGQKYKKCSEAAKKTIRVS